MPRVELNLLSTPAAKSKQIANLMDLAYTPLRLAVLSPQLTTCSLGPQLVSFATKHDSDTTANVVLRG